MIMRLPIVAITAMCCLAGSVSAQDVFVDHGACPGEGCVYAETWIAEAAVALYTAADTTSPVVATLAPGDQVQTLTGEVHTTVPGVFRVVNAHGDFAPGDEVLLYTYRGEGWFHVRHNGVFKDADLRIGPNEPSSVEVLRQCDEMPSCRGVLQREPRYQWWVKVRTTQGREGWINAPGLFDTPGQH